MISVVATASASAAGGNSATTPPIDTTTAKLIEINVSIFVGGAATVSDSKGNVWNALLHRQRVDNGNVRVQKWYAYCATSDKSGSGHTFTVNGVGSFAVITVRAYTATNILLFLAESAGGGVTGTSVTSGSMTPIGVPALITSGFGSNAVFSGLAVSGGGLAIYSSVNFSSGQNMGLACADEIQASVAARDAAWSWTPSMLAAANGACYVEYVPGVNQYGEIEHTRTPDFGNAPWLGIDRSAPIQKYEGNERLFSNMPAAPEYGVQMMQPVYLGARRVRMKLDGRWVVVLMGAGVWLKQDDDSWTEIGEF